MNASVGLFFAFVTGLMNSLALWCMFTASQKVPSVAAGVLHWESNSRKMPCGFFSMRSMQPWLSWNSTARQLTPSVRWISSSALKTHPRKNCCSFSLAKLMQSCSNELSSQHVDLQRVSSTASSRASSKTASRQGSRVTSPLNTPPSTPARTLTPIFAQSSPPRLTERLPAAATPPPPPLSAEAAADRTPPMSPYGT